MPFDCQIVNKFIVKMATTGVGFRWLDILEKEFDKACVELDTSIVELDSEESESVFAARQKIATLSSCFAQLTHKALTIFQNSAKLEDALELFVEQIRDTCVAGAQATVAPPLVCSLLTSIKMYTFLNAELVDMRAELVQARAASGPGGCPDDSDATGDVSDGARARAEAAQLARENAALRETVLALHSELFGARLATKYLDKELAGRIQQLQLLGRDMRAEVRDSLWAQVEAEILLQRHKTLVRVCRGLAPCPARPARAPRSPRPPRPRTVRVRRSPHLGLGISVTGGREHGVPVLISELEAGGPAALTGELFVGDAILAINDRDLTQACHKEAVAALQGAKGDCALRVQFLAADDDDRLSDDNYRFPLYPEDDEFGAEPDGSGATPTAPRTPDYDRPPSAAESHGSGPHYPAYSINNNLSIVDLDEDSIVVARRGPYGPLPASASASASASEATPVHQRRRATKKKRKDWRSKGAYHTVDGAHSSDEVSAEPEPEPAPAPAPSPPPAPPPPPAPAPAPKPFRIGSARRVSASALCNGVPPRRAPPLAGDGDPDFGTPV